VVRWCGGRHHRCDKNPARRGEEVHRRYETRLRRGSQEHQRGAGALIPLFILFFGITDINKIAIAGFSVFLIVTFNSAYGVMNARKSRILAAQVMGASRFAIFRDVLIFESLPQTFVGLRNGISTALVIVVVAEMFIGSDQGLGHRIIEGEQVLHVTDMYASIIVAGLLGYFLNVAFMLADKRFIHWNGK
jgi:NitT/TauT family transport system permease protein